MLLNMQKPGWQAGVSLDHDLLCDGWSFSFNIASERQAQMLASRFFLSPWLAREVASLCFGEVQL